MSKTVVLIPAFNAEKTIRDVINKLDRKIVNAIIVVDDGSYDNTKAILSTIGGINVVSHPCNRGYGATAITLYKESFKDDFDFFITVHADGGHDPCDIAKILQPLKDGVADVVVGNRIEGILIKTPLFLKSKFLGAMIYGEMPVYKFIANIILTKFQNWCYKSNFHSFHSGSRGCTRKALERIPFDTLSAWYLYDTEFLIKANEKKLRIEEIPVCTHYLNDAGSGVPVIKYGIRIVIHALLYWFRKRQARIKKNIKNNAVK